MYSSRINNVATVACSSPGPRTIEVWANRMPMIGQPRTSDRVTLDAGWASAPVELLLNGASYPVLEAQGMTGPGGAPFRRFDAYVPLFPSEGDYSATVKLANGNAVKVNLAVKFAH